MGQINKLRNATFFVIFIAVFFAAFAGNAHAQRRDFLTDSEIDVIRESQDIDVRIDSIIKMIDRRFTLMNVDVQGWDGRGRNADVFGDPPKGTREELLFDIKRLLQKAIDDIDNLAERPDSALVRREDEVKEKKKDPKRFGIAVRALAAASQRYIDPLRKLYDSAESEKELGVISDSINSCELIIESQNNLPAETNDKKKKKPGS